MIFLIHTPVVLIKGIVRLRAEKIYLRIEKLFFNGISGDSLGHLQQLRSFLPAVESRNLECSRHFSLVIKLHI